MSVPQKAPTWPPFPASMFTAVINADCYSTNPIAFRFSEAHHMIQRVHAYQGGVDVRRPSYLVLHSLTAKLVSDVARYGLAQVGESDTAKPLGPVLHAHFLLTLAGCVKGQSQAQPEWRGTSLG